MTVIMIAPRLSRIKIADYIYYLKNGKVVEERSYKDLLKQNGGFAKLHELES